MGADKLQPPCRTVRFPNRASRARPWYFQRYACTCPPRANRAVRPQGYIARGYEQVMGLPATTRSRLPQGVPAFGSALDDCNGCSNIGCAATRNNRGRFAERVADPLSDGTVVDRQARVQG